ncbi:glutaredoxin-1 [Thalassophryne amazonica]|uniref:glutaredoxin-1 n=1 Tax=Thalassophryne amazonica TaxID=390379 RepID=UPI001471BE4F|nr:glutaredoxin-1 [Thalassophryne amazonica]XP_034023006.1 glutaredoxin-1 [Thalassophryne amazonica]
MAEEFVKAKIKGDKVVLFTRPSCPYCIMAKDVMSKYKFKPGHLEYVDIGAQKDMGSLQDYFLELTGARTVPRVFIGDKCVGGGSDVVELHESGDLEVMLQGIRALQ